MKEGKYSIRGEERRKSIVVICFHGFPFCSDKDPGAVRDRLSSVMMNEEQTTTVFFSILHFPECELGELCNGWRGTSAAESETSQFTKFENPAPRARSLFV